MRVVTRDPDRQLKNHSVGASGESPLAAALRRAGYGTGEQVLDTVNEKLDGIAASLREGPDE